MSTITERNLRSVDLNLLVVFDALMTERHVTRAASRNGLSQPAVSKALNRLRCLFDDPLFIRRDRRMVPTPRAIELSGPIHGALADISRTLALPTAFDPAGICATVTIATADFYQGAFLPALIRRLRGEAPGLQLQLKAGDRFFQYESLESGSIDIAIGPGIVKEGLRAVPLWKDRLTTLLASDHPLANCLTLETFARAAHAVDTGHVRIGPDGQVSSIVDAILAASGLQRKIAVALPSCAAIPAVVAAADLIATLPSRVVRDLSPGENIVQRPAPFQHVEVSPHMIWHARTEEMPLQSWLRSVIAQTVSQMDLQSSGREGHLHSLGDSS
jgi:DNA-binding transcriptional LysR family regulator